MDEKHVTAGAVGMLSTQAQINGTPAAAVASLTMRRRGEGFKAASFPARRGMYGCNKYSR